MEIWQLLNLSFWPSKISPLFFTIILNNRMAYKYNDRIRGPIKWTHYSGKQVPRKLRTLLHTSRCRTPARFAPSCAESSLGEINKNPRIAKDKIYQSVLRGLSLRGDTRCVVFFFFFFHSLHVNFQGFFYCQVWQEFLSFPCDFFWYTCDGISGVSFVHGPMDDG
jgi:hypothetical protein